MKITLKLFAMLSRYLPAGAHRNALEAEAPEGISAGALMDALGVPRAEVNLVLLDGSAVALEALDETILRDGQTLALWPPIAGG